MTYLFWESKPRSVESTVPIVCPDELRYHVLELLDGLAISDYQQTIGESMQNKCCLPFLTLIKHKGRTMTQVSDVTALVFGAAFSAVHMIA